MIQVVFVVIGVVMGILALVLLIFGFLATGATRKNVYSGNKCIMGGRVSAAFVSMRNLLIMHLLLKYMYICTSNICIENSVFVSNVLA